MIQTRRGGFLRRLLVDFLTALRRGEEESHFVNQHPPPWRVLRHGSLVSGSVVKYTGVPG